MRLMEFYNYIDHKYPFSLQLDFDNSGIQIGFKEKSIHKILFCLDITEQTVSEAIECSADLIVSHHPMFFNPAKSISDFEFPGQIAIRLIQNSISVISMHTNYDIAEGGVNDCLMRLLGADILCPLDEDHCGRIGTLPQRVTLEHFLAHCENRLMVNGLRYYSAGKDCERIAVMGGAGKHAIRDAALQGCDTYVTSDIGYHDFQLAERLGINLIDAGHFCTENPAMACFMQSAQMDFPDTEMFFSKGHKQIEQYY